MTKEDKQCKAICHSGERCSKPGYIIGYCATHFNIIYNAGFKYSIIKKLMESDKRCIVRIVAKK